MDDDRAVADSLSAILSSAGYHVQTFYCGRTALTEALVTAPDAVISDVVMPGLGGVELAVELGEALPDCKVILFTGQAATSSNLLRRAGQKGYEFPLLEKPVHPADLLQRLKQLWQAATLYPSPAV